MNTHETYRIDDLSEEELDNLLDYEGEDHDVHRIEDDFEGEAKYSSILRAFVEAACDAEPGDRIVYEDEFEVNSAIITQNEHGDRDGMILYRGLPDVGSRIGWYGFVDMAGWSEILERFRKGYTETVLKGKA